MPIQTIDLQSRKFRTEAGRTGVRGGVFGTSTSLEQFVGGGGGAQAGARANELLGGQAAARGPTGAIRGLRAADLTFGGRLQAAGEEDLSAVEQFLSPTLTGTQERGLSDIVQRSAAGGLAGGAVTARVEQARTSALASNRASALSRVSGLVQSRLGQVRGLSAGLFQQAGAFSKLRSAGGLGNALAIIAASGTGMRGDPGSLRGFATPALAGLEALGLGAAARSAVGRISGREITGEAVPLTEEETRLSGALTSFLEPTLTAEQETSAVGRAQQIQRTARSRGRSTNIRRDISRQRAEALGGVRTEAAETLSGAVGGRLQTLAGSAAELAAAGGSFAALQQAGAGGAAQIAGFDVSRFKNLFKTLGLTR